MRLFLKAMQKSRRLSALWLLIVTAAGSMLLASPAIAYEDDKELEKRVDSIREVIRDRYGTPGQRLVPPVEINRESGIDPFAAEPINVSTVILTTQTPTEEFTESMAPLMLGLTAGVVFLGIWTWSRAVDEADAKNHS